MQSYPEESIDRVQGWTRPFPFEDGDLLPESENFKGGVASTAEEHADGSEKTEYAFRHETTVVTWRNVASIDNPAKAAGWLVLKLQEVLASDTQLEKASSLLPGDASLHFALAQALQRAGRSEEAAQQVHQGQTLQQRQKDASLATADINLAAELLRKGEAASAEAKLREAVSLAPRDPLTHYHYGLAFLLQSKLQQAIAEFRTTLDLRPDDPDTLYYLGRALLESNRPAEAVESLRHALEINPADAHARNVLAVALARTKDFSTAAAELKRALAAEPDSSLYLQNLRCIEQQMRACDLVP